MTTQPTPEPPRIITHHVNPPIPIRDHDWCAYYDGREESSAYGWGATEQEAIEDLRAYDEEPINWPPCIAGNENASGSLTTNNLDAQAKINRLFDKRPAGIDTPPLFRTLLVISIGAIVGIILYFIGKP